MLLCLIVGGPFLAFIYAVKFCGPLLTLIRVG
jgi:hypothetical protein